MIWFAILIALLTVIALLWVLPPLLRRRPKTDGIARPASNLSILRDQLAELDADLRNGVITAEQHAKSRGEIERRVLEETRMEAGAPAAAASATRWTAAALGVLIPVVALSLYLLLGNPAGLSPQPAVTAAEHQLSSKQIEKLVAKLADRLAKNPEQGQGWAILARSYVVLHRYPEAVTAFEKATQLLPNDAGLYADYADALAMTQGRRIEGKALQLVNRALAIDPTQFKALALAGSAAYAKKDYKGALAYWEKLQQLIPPDSDLAKSLAGSIAEARNLGGISVAGKPVEKTASTAPAAAAISGKVTLSPNISSKANPQDTLFVLARASNGPRMPLAVIRRKVKDLPLEFTLDDSLSMSPAAKLSGFPEVTLIAHVSKSGGVLAQSGDLEGSETAVKVGSKDVTLVIDKVVP